MVYKTNGVEMTKENNYKYGDAYVADCALPKPSSYYIATKSLSNSNGDANYDV